MPGGNAAGAPSSSSLSSQDQTFLNFASQADVSEIAAAQVALKQSSTTSVHNFANRMISDHSSEQQTAQSLASALGITLPTTPLPAEAAKLASYQNLTGNAFDLAYAKDQVGAQQTAIAMFQQEVSSGSNDQVIAFAKNSLPILQTHLQLAEQLLASCGGATPTPGP
jgi:putative membrane protein